MVSSTVKFERNHDILARFYISIKSWLALPTLYAKNHLNLKTVSILRHI